MFPVPGIALDVQQRLRKGLLRRTDHTRRRCRWLDGVQGPWRGALSLGGRSWLTPRSLHSEGAQRVALGTVRGGVWVGRTALTWGWPPAFHSFHLPFPTVLGHAQCRALGTHPSFMSSLVWPEGYGTRGGIQQSLGAQGRLSGEGAFLSKGRRNVSAPQARICTLST